MGFWDTYPCLFTRVCHKQYFFIMFCDELRAVCFLIIKTWKNVLKLNIYSAIVKYENKVTNKKMTTLKLSCILSTVNHIYTNIFFYKCLYTQYKLCFFVYIGVFFKFICFESIAKLSKYKFFLLLDISSIMRHLSFYWVVSTFNIDLWCMW
jgi:hypothetical protein